MNVQLQVGFAGLSLVTPRFRVEGTYKKSQRKRWIGTILKNSWHVLINLGYMIQELWSAVCGRELSWGWVKRRLIFGGWWDGCSGEQSHWSASEDAVVTDLQQTETHFVNEHWKPFLIVVHTHIVVHAHIHTGGYIRGNSGFSISAKDTSACGLEESGINLPTSRLPAPPTDLQLLFNQCGLQCKYRTQWVQTSKCYCKQIKSKLAYIRLTVLQKPFLRSMR